MTFVTSWRPPEANDTLWYTDYEVTNLSKINKYKLDAMGVNPSQLLYNLLIPPVRLSVPNLLLNKDELTIRVQSGDHSWSFLVILAMTMTMTIYSNSVLLIRVTSAGQHESLNMLKHFVYPVRYQILLQNSCIKY